MPGGLIQLLTIGLQDAPLVLNPEITFFKTIYRKHTNFSIEQIIKNIGKKKFNSFHQFKINTVTDLLADMHFIIDIPYFNVIKTINTSSQITNSYDINELSVNYDKVKTYLFFESSSNHYYLVPETFFNLSKNDNFYNQVFGVDLEKNLLAGLDLLSVQNYGTIVDVFKLNNSKLNQLLPVFRLNFSQWSEFWLRIFESEDKNFNYLTNIISQLDLVLTLRKKLELILYDGFVNYNVFNENDQYLNFKDEIINFVYYNLTTSPDPIYDADYAKNYAILNNFDLATYKLNALKFNSLFYLFILQSLYPTFVSKCKSYTFWKKYELGLNNIVDNTAFISTNNYFLEWTKRFILYNDTSYGNYEKLDVQIYDSFKQQYSICEQNILFLFNSMQVQEEEKIWCILKTFYNQFTDNTTNIICFEDHFNPNSNLLYLDVKINDFFENVYPTLLKTSNLNTTWSTFDDPTYIQPVDLVLSYPYLCYKFINSIINLNDFNDYHFFLLWRNKITIAYFFRNAYNLDNYISEKTNDNGLQNTFLELNDYSQTKSNKKLTFYHNINLNRNIKIDNIQNEFNNLFNTESFYGNINILENDLSNNLILISPTYNGLNDISYNIINQKVEIIDEMVFSYLYDTSQNIIEINDWNKTVYNNIYIEINNNFVEIDMFSFKKNSLFIYPNNILKLDPNNIKLKLVKNLSIPLIDFNAVIDSNGYVNYPNISFNIDKFPDISFNSIDYPSVTYNIINLFSVDENNIVLANEIHNNTITQSININNNHFYELKIVYSNNTIERKNIIIDSSNNILTPIDLNLNKIVNIDLLEYDFNLNLVSDDVTYIFNTDTSHYKPSVIIDTTNITINTSSFYWLIAYKDISNNLLPERVFLPIKIDSMDNFDMETCDAIPILIVLGYNPNLKFDLFEINSTLVPNLFPILHHHLNTDASNNIINYQLNSYFYQQPYIFNTFSKILKRNADGNIVDSSDNVIDEENHRLNLNLEKILKRLDTNTEYSYSIDSSGNLVDLDAGYLIVTDPSGSTNFVLEDINNDYSIVLNSNNEVIYLNYLFGNGLYYISSVSSEPFYYFYNFPINNFTKSIKINGNKINKLLPINPSEFYIKDDISYPVVFDQTKIKSLETKDSLIIKLNKLFDKIFLNDTNFSPIVNIIEKATNLYENLNLDGIKLLKQLGKTINNVIGNTSIINGLNLENYNNYDYNKYSLFVPYYYNVNTTEITSGIGIQKFKIASKGYILTQPTQIYESSDKISTNLKDYLLSVSNTLIENINYVTTYQDLNESLNENEYINSFLPKYKLEDTIIKLLYTPTDYKIETLFNLNNNYSNENTEIYLNNLLIDISSNNIAKSTNMFEISEQKIYNNEIIYKPYNNFDENKFNYIGPVNFISGDFIFNDTYELINDIEDTYLLLDDYKIVKYLNIEQEQYKIKNYYNSYECTLEIDSEPTNINQKIDYVYQLNILVDLSNNIITGNSIVINFKFFKLEIFNGLYILIGDSPLDLESKYLIGGDSSDNTIESFVPSNFYIIRNITIYNNFKSNVNIEGINSNKVYENVLLDYINTNDKTYYSYIETSETSIFLYNLSNMYLLPPFKLVNSNIKLITQHREFILNIFNKSHYYKLDNRIFKGSELDTYDISGNFNLWIYPNSNLKLVNTNKTAYISNNTLYISSIDNLPNFTFYYVDGIIIYIDTIQTNFDINYSTSDISSNILYFLDDENFIKRDQQYISIIDSSSIEFICPDMDASSNNNYFKNETGINSYYYFDFKNKNDDIYRNEIDIIGVFEDNSGCRFMMPFSYNYLRETETALVYVYYNDQNYNNFLFYKINEVDSSGFIHGNLYSDSNLNNIYSFINCYESDFIIEQQGNNFSFKLKASSGFKKYKVWFGLLIGDIIVNKFSYIWTLQISNTNNCYYSIFDLQDPTSSGQLFYPYNTFSDNEAKKDVIMFQINIIYKLVGNNQLIYENSAYINFNNYFQNRNRQQRYYHNNILYNQNKLNKLEYNYDTSLDYFPDLDNMGIINEINGNLIYYKNPKSDLTYLILIGKQSKYFCNIINTDISNGIITINMDIPKESYTIYSSSRDLIFTTNQINICKLNNNYFISSYEKNSLKTGDIIMVDNNVFEIIGLNSDTLFYDIKPLQIKNLKSKYLGYYYLYRNHQIPIIPEFENIVEFTINTNNKNKMLFDASNNLVFNNIDISSQEKFFSIAEGENIYLYYKDNKLYNVYNYILHNNDYLIEIDSNTNLKIKYIKDDVIYLSTNLDYQEGFYTFYVPYQPFKMENLIFDDSGILTNDKDDFYFELDGGFINTKKLDPYTDFELANTSLFTRILVLPYQNLYFENKTISPLIATLDETTLTFSNNINLAEYDLFYNQNILINSFVSYIKKVILPNKIIINALNFPLTVVNVYLGLRTDQQLSCNYLLDKAHYLKPLINLNYYNYYDILNDEIYNYDVSSNFVDPDSIIPHCPDPPNEEDPLIKHVIFQDNIFNLDISNNMLNLIDSYHILLEKTKFNQYISYLCKIKLPNRLFINGTVQSYDSEFYIDKIYPIILNIDNTISFKDIRLIKQFILGQIPQNEIIIWKKYDLILNGLVENIDDGFQIEIDIENLPNINENDFYIDKKTKCKILDISGNYYLQSTEFFENIDYIYTKTINYLKKSIKNTYSSNININPIFEKPFGLESIQLPIELKFKSNIDFYYYDTINNLNYFSNESTNISVGQLNLPIVSTYIDMVSNKRIFTTKTEIINSKLNYVYLNDFKTNIFNEENIYLDSVASITNIFNDTNFMLSTLFNPIKSWNTWSVLTNPDISKTVLLQGNIYIDTSYNITTDTSENYYTYSEVYEISEFLNNVLSNYDKFESLKYFETAFYENLPNFIKYEKFWMDPIVYINNFLIDISSSIIFTGTDLTLNGKSLNSLIINNQFIVISENDQFSVNRDLSFVVNEIYNLVNNKSDNNIYGVKINDVLKHIIELSTQYINLKDSIINFVGRSVNFADVLLYIFKDKLATSINFRAMNNFSSLGIDYLDNTITYDKNYDQIEYLKDYPFITTQNLLNINVPYELNYSIDTSSGLYPYAIFLEDDTYSTHTIYRVDFLEGEKILNKISVDNPLIFNNQIQFYSKVDFDINHDFSIAAYKTYDISSSKFVGYAYSVDYTNSDASTIDFNLFAQIKYKNMELSIYNNYLVFPNYIDNLNSFIQAELNIGINTHDIFENYTYIEMLKINQTFIADSVDYSVYLSNDNKCFRVEEINGRSLKVKGTLTTFKNTKLIITIKPSLITYLNLLVYSLNLSENLINYAYYFDLKNVPKNFLINDEIMVEDLKFIGDDVIDVLLNSTDISNNFVFQSIVHYSKIGEYPPEPIQNMEKMDSFLFEFLDIPPINDISSCFIYYDSSYNSHEDADIFIQNFINDISSYDFVSSTDVIKFDYKTQFVCNKFIDDKDIHYHTFGGVINKWDISDYTYSNNLLVIKSPDKFVFNSKYSYLINNIFIDVTNFKLIGNTINITTDIGITGTFTFTQIIIQTVIDKPENNQMCSIDLFDPLDIRYDGYIQTLNKSGDEIGEYVYLLSFNTELDPIQYIENDSIIYIYGENIINGQILFPDPYYIYIVSNEPITNIDYILLNGSKQKYTPIQWTLVQYSYVPFTLYKKIAMGNYLIFIKEQSFNFLDNFIFNLDNMNKFYLISKFAKFKLDKKFANQKITPSEELMPSVTNSSTSNTVLEQAIFKPDVLYRKFFEYVEFYIGEQLVEQLDENVMNVQYQFLKDDNKRNQINKMTKVYEYNNGNRFIVPLEFWFNGDSTKYIPLICLTYTLISLKFKINNIKELLANTNYVLKDIPEVNVQISIDGIMLDTIERELFGNTQHEYIIERFKNYPDSLISSLNGISRMKFKNMVKDIFFVTEIITTKENTYISYTYDKDTWLIYYEDKRALYNEFLLIGVFTDKIGSENALDFDIIKIAINDIKLQADRYIYFKASPILSKYDMEYVLFLDGKYLTNFTTLLKRRKKLELYFTGIYKNIKITNKISPITTLNIQSSGTDLFKPLNSSYFNSLVPYKKYLTTVDEGYYVYSFSLNPLEKQPSGHINFTMLDDIVINTVNNERTVDDPFILKTCVREYQILRIMSGMGSLAWFD